MADFPASDEGLESRRTFDAALADLMASAQTFPAVSRVAPRVVYGFVLFRSLVIMPFLASLDTG